MLTSFISNVSVGALLLLIFCVFPVQYLSYKAQRYYGWAYIAIRISIDYAVFIGSGIWQLSCAITSML